VDVDSVIDISDAERRYLETQDERNSDSDLDDTGFIFKACGKIRMIR
jgi:hypothetical protein